MYKRQVDPCAPTPSKRGALLSRFYSEHRQPKGHHKRGNQVHDEHTEERSSTAHLTATHGIPSPSPSFSTSETAAQHTRNPTSCPPDDTSCDAQDVDSGAKDVVQKCWGKSLRTGRNLACMHPLVNGSRYKQPLVHLQRIQVPKADFCFPVDDISYTIDSCAHVGAQI